MLPARTLLPHKIHLLLVSVVDLEFGQRAGVLSDQPAFAQPTGVCEQLFLEVFGDPLLDDNVVGVDLVPVPWQTICQEGIGEKMSPVDLFINVRLVHN